MKVNWKKCGFSTDPWTYLVAGILFILSGVLFFYLHSDRPIIKGKDDLQFLSGSFEYYKWEKAGSGSRATFKLSNFPIRFRIIADFYPIFEFDSFKTIERGEQLTVAVQKSDLPFLNRNVGEIRVYSLNSENKNYLDINKAIKKHNSPLLYYMGTIFILVGIIIIYYSNKSIKKRKTAHNIVHLQ